MEVPSKDFLGHAISAAEIAPVGHRYPQIVQGPVQLVQKKAHMLRECATKAYPAPTPTQTSPSSKYSFFQTGTVALSISRASLHPSKASRLWGADVAMTTLISPMPSLPTRWRM